MSKTEDKSSRRGKRVDTCAFLQKAGAWRELHRTYQPVTRLNFSASLLCIYIICNPSARMKLDRVTGSLLGNTKKANNITTYLLIRLKKKTCKESIFRRFCAIAILNKHHKHTNLYLFIGFERQQTFCIANDTRKCAYGYFEWITPTVVKFGKSETHALLTKN